MDEMDDMDEMDEVARISGVPEIRRKSHLHALNVKAMAKRAAAVASAPPALRAAHTSPGPALTAE